MSPYKNICDTWRCTCEWGWESKVDFLFRPWNVSKTSSQHHICSSINSPEKSSAWLRVMWRTVWKNLSHSPQIEATNLSHPKDPGHPKDAHPKDFLSGMQCGCATRKWITAYSQLWTHLLWLKTMQNTSIGVTDGPKLEPYKCAHFL
jgi:hypothetical protein